MSGDICQSCGNQIPPQGHEPGCRVPLEERISDLEERVEALERPTVRSFLDREFGLSFPRIVTLCGSTRFVDAFNEQRKRLTHEGVIVLSIEIVTTQQYWEDPQHVKRDNKAMLDELHKRKIDLSDSVLVLNVGGYIGESTRSEIDYAVAHGKPVEYLYAD